MSSGGLKKHWKTKWFFSLWFKIISCVSFHNLMESCNLPNFFQRFFDVDHFFKSLYWIYYNIDCYIYIYIFFFFWLPGMWDLSSPTKDRSPTTVNPQPLHGNMKSYLLDPQGIPSPKVSCMPFTIAMLVWRHNISWLPLLFMKLIPTTLGPNISWKCSCMSLGN